MTRRMAFATPLLLSACMACQPGETQAVRNDLKAPTGEVSCGAEAYQGFVGEKLAAVTYPSDLDVRIIEPGMAYTMEYDPGRMNIHVDEEGTITKVRCG